MSQPDFERLFDFLLDIKKEQSEIKEQTIKNTLILEHNTSVLEEHERRSTASETRIEKLEDQSQMFYGFLKISGTILGIIGTIVGIIYAIHQIL